MRKKAFLNGPFSRMKKRSNYSRREEEGKAHGEKTSFGRVKLDRGTTMCVTVCKNVCVSVRGGAGETDGDQNVCCFDQNEPAFSLIRVEQLRQMGTKICIFFD